MRPRNIRRSIPTPNRRPSSPPTQPARTRRTKARMQRRRESLDESFAMRAPESGHAVHLVLDAAGTEAPLRDEDALVEPRITRVAGLEPRRGAEILVAVIGARTFGKCVSDLLIHLEQSVVLHIQRGAVVGEELGAHVESSESIRCHQQPVAATS